jgi:hypothetical protein
MVRSARRATGVPINFLEALWLSSGIASAEALLRFIEDKEPFRIERARPSVSAPEAGNTHPLGKMFVRVPITELRALFGPNAPPHSQRGFKRHADFSFPRTIFSHAFEDQ